MGRHLTIVSTDMNVNTHIYVKIQAAIEHIADFVPNAIGSVMIMRSKSVLSSKAPRIAAMGVLKKEDAHWKRNYTLLIKHMKSIKNVCLNPEAEFVLMRKKSHVWMS